MTGVPSRDHNSDLAVAKFRFQDAIMEANRIGGVYLSDILEQVWDVLTCDPDRAKIAILLTGADRD